MKKSTPALFTATLLLALLTIGAAGWLGYLAYRGQLAGTWGTLNEAQATVLAQILFIWAAAWAAVLVPLLFGEQLKSLEAAASAAAKTSKDIEQKLETSLELAQQQFAEISGYQQQLLGFVADEGLLTSLADKKGFVDGTWAGVSQKISQAMGRLHGNARKAIEQHTWRSQDWWNALLQSGALGEFFQDFKDISDITRNLQKGAEPSLEQLKKVNDAAKRISGFDPTSKGAEDKVDVVLSELRALKELIARIGSQQSSPAN